MDIVAHALYGATVCSRSGLAGGAAGATGRHWSTDWTVWLAVLFSILPDAVSLGPPLLYHWLADLPGNFFAELGASTLLRYRYLHSLLVALAAAGLLRVLWKPLFVPALAWALHIALDALTHGGGRFQTPLFYPLSTWGVEGLRWWEHPLLVLGYWLVPPIVWLALWIWRRTRKT